MPLEGIEPSSQPPEGCTLSIKLQGQNLGGQVKLWGWKREFRSLLSL